MSPYDSLSPHAFWRSAIADKSPFAISDIWAPKFEIDQDDAIVTAGSCFAQHIRQALVEHDMHWLDAEPAPGNLSESERTQRQYGVFSFRTGNIYTAAMLRQWVSWALGAETCPDEIWQEGREDRFHDPFRPAVEPDGFSSEAELRRSRAVTLQAIRRAVTEAKYFVFTLGLTEAWIDRAGGFVYPVCPGTIRGGFDAERHAFRNFAFAEVYRDLAAAFDLMRQANPGIRFLLTVSPVPLTATASGAHVLCATTYSKSVLRAVAGQLCGEFDDIDYFPSYEIITGFPFRGIFFESNMRSVSAHGVEFVMRRFFEALNLEKPLPARRPPLSDLSAVDLFCEDAVLDYYKHP